MGCDQTYQCNDAEQHPPITADRERFLPDTFRSRSREASLCFGLGGDRSQRVHAAFLPVMKWAKATTAAVLSNTKVAAASPARAIGPRFNKRARATTPNP